MSALTGSPSTKHSMFVVPCSIDVATETLTPIPAGSATDPIATSDAGSAFTPARGLTNSAPFTSADQHSAAASVTAAPTSGQKLVIDDLVVSVDTTMSVTFQEETTARVVLGPLYLSANTAQQFTLRGKLKLTTADKKLQVITSVAGNISVQSICHSEA